MPAAPDFLAEVLRKIAATSRTDDDLRRAETTIRRQMGGGHYYVARSAAEERAREVQANVAAGMSLRDACTAAGVSRSSGYRLIKRR